MRVFPLLEVVRLIEVRLHEANGDYLALPRRKPYRVFQLRELVPTFTSFRSGRFCLIELPSGRLKRYSSPVEADWLRYGRSNRRKNLIGAVMLVGWKIKATEMVGMG